MGGLGSFWMLFVGTSMVSNFSVNQTEVDSRAVWIRLPGLLEGYYSECLLRAIGGAIGKVIKLDAHTGCARRGRFARLVVCVDLKKL